MGTGWSPVLLCGKGFFYNHQPMYVKKAPKPRVSMATIGCRLNQAESALLRDGFLRRGFDSVECGEDTEVFVINSCTVTEGAEKDCRQLVRRVLRRSPQAFVAVTGCYAQTGLDTLRKIQGIDLIVGNQYKMQLPDLLPPLSVTTKRVSPDIVHGRMDREDFSIEGVGDYATTRANLKIQDGCQFMCSFCLIPFARGRERSRLLEDAVREAEELVARGHRELVLTGVNIGQYRSGQADLIRLLDRLEPIQHLDRIRISSIEPTTVPDGLLEYMSTSRKVCRYLHVPLQSGDDAILRAMNRRYTVRDYERAMESALKIIPDVCFGTDVMVGFPGEGPKEFTHTQMFLRSLPFAYFHVFSYSPRPGTAATKLSHKVSPNDMKERSRMLQALSQDKRRIFQQRFLGQRVSVLFETEESRGYWKGLTDHYLRVAVRSSQNLLNTIHPVMVTGLMKDHVMGLLPPPDPITPNSGHLTMAPEGAFVLQGH